MNEEYQAKVNADIEANVQRVMKDGPGLRTTTRHNILAIDPDTNMILLTGLGAMGVGTMWCGYFGGKEGKKQVLEALKGGVPIQSAVDQFGYIEDKKNYRADLSKVVEEFNAKQ